MTINEIADTLINSNKQLTQLAAYLKNELDNYKARPGAHPLYIDIKEKQIKMLEGVNETYSTLFDQVLNHFEELRKTERELRDKTTKAEACCLYYGVSFYEMQSFTSDPLETALNRLKEAITEGWRQVPINLQHQMKEADEKDFEYTCEMNPETKELEKTILEKPKNNERIRFVEQPLIPFNHLKRLAANG